MTLNPVDLRWQVTPFEALKPAELQNIHMARQQVFIIEQQCIFLDADGVDEQCWHLAAWTAAERMPLAYARLVAPGVKYAEASIGRVITTATARGTGLGRALMRRAVAECERLWPGRGIRISAQAHLAPFYGEFGFVGIGEPYDEDGIPHLEMLRPSPHTSPLTSPA